MTIIQLFLHLSFLLMVTHYSCISDKSFCIDDIAYSSSAKSGEHTIVLPDGQSYSGVGALPFSVTIGEYGGILASVVTSQVPSDKGLNVKLVHFFDDGEGNAFWTNDKATMIPTSDPSGAVMKVDDDMTVVGGTGDFQCATGLIKNTGTIDFIAASLEVKLTGSICAGCK